MFSLLSNVERTFFRTESQTSNIMTILYINVNVSRKPHRGLGEGGSQINNKSHHRFSKTFYAKRSVFTNTIIFFNQIYKQFSLASIPKYFTQKHACMDNIQICKTSSAVLLLVTIYAFLGTLCILLTFSHHCLVCARQDLKDV